MSWERVKCPKCGQPAGSRCRTTSGTNKVTGTHSLRTDAAWWAARGYGLGYNRLDHCEIQ